MKVKLFIVFALFAANIPTNSFSAEDYYTEESMHDAAVYARSKYGRLVGELREGDSVKTPEVKKLFENDPDLERVHDGGHDTYKHKRFPISFGIVSRKKDEIGKSARNEMTRDLQVYVNAIRKWVFLCDRRDVSKKNKVKNANSVTADEFMGFIKKEEKLYDFYSIQPQKNKKK